MGDSLNSRYFLKKKKGKLLIFFSVFNWVSFILEPKSRFLPCPQKIRSSPKKLNIHRLSKNNSLISYSSYLFCKKCPFPYSDRIWINDILSHHLKQNREGRMGLLPLPHFIAKTDKFNEFNFTQKSKSNVCFSLKLRRNHLFISGFRLESSIW